MMTKTKFRTALLMTVSAGLLAACGGSGNVEEDLVTLHRGNSAEPLTLDPHKASGTWENNIIGDMFIGLFTDDEFGSPIPGMAESWEVSEDGLTWTFELREASWSDGVPVTAHDFEYAMQRILTPATLAQYASLLYPIENAQAVNQGNLDPSELGVEAVDDDTLIIRLENPAPYLQGLLTHYTTFPVPRHVVEEVGDQWVQPEHIEVNGPYQLVQWSTNNFVHVERNELFFDNENVCIDEVFYYPTVDSAAGVRRVQNGELHVNNEFPGQHIDRLEREMGEYVRVYPYMGTVYFSMNTEMEMFADPRVRNALGMAINREFLVDEIYRDGRAAAYAFVPPNVANYAGGVSTEWAEWTMEQRLERARELLEEAGYGPDNPFEFEYTHRSTGDNPRIAPVVQQDWESIADWVNVEIVQIETQIHYENLRSADYQVGDGGWIADYNDAYNFLFLAEERSIPMNYSRYRNPEYDDLLARGNRELDMEVRASLFAEAEQIMVDDMPVIPIAFYVNRAVVSPDVTGWEDNVVHIHRTRYMCLSSAETAEAGSSGETASD